MNQNENLFIPASMGYDQEMVLETKDWVERLNPDSKLPNFNTGRILVPKSQAINESLKPTKTSNTPESSKDSEAESLTPLPPLKNLQGASPSSEVMPLTFQPHFPRERPGLGIMKHTKLETQDSLDKSVSGTITVSETKPTTPSVPTEVKNTEQESKINELTKLIELSKSVDSSKTSQDSKPKVHNVGLSKSLRPKPIQKLQLRCELCHYTNHLTDDCYRILYCMICKREDHRTSDHEIYIVSLKRSKNYKAQPYQYASSSKQILRAKEKPFPPCTHYDFNDHRPDDCRNYPECGICRSYDHFTSGHNHVIHIRGGVLFESSQSSESLIGVKCNTCGSTIHSTTDHNDFDHFKIETHQGAHLVPGQWILKEYDWCQELSAQICRATRKCLHILHMDLFEPVSPMSINHEKYTLVIIDEYSRSIIVKRHDKTPYEIFRERILDISYFHVFGCPVFIHNHKYHLGKFDAKADDGYFLGYSFVSKAFRVFNTRRQQVEETYNVIFDESMEAIRFTITLVDEIGIEDSSRYIPDEFLQEDDSSREYQVDSDVSYYIILHRRSLTKLT
ncbi:retrovirus-related pol polyprotein from transposon TNT 1-94 [Tanacetum coccineum]